MIYAIQFNEQQKVVGVHSFRNESEVPSDLIIYRGSLQPQLLLNKTKQELGI